MFCPNCGSEDRQGSQFCRACGTDMRAIRQGLEKPESVMASVMSAREEIGRAIAARIREVRDAKDLKILEEVLPEVQSFFETPEERRLRRIRAGVVTAMCGLGGTFFFYFMSFKEPDMLFMIMAGVTTFLIGFGIILNGLLFTTTKEQRSQRSLDDAREDFERAVTLAAKTRQELPASNQTDIPLPSVTEHTTHKLPNDSVLAPKAGAKE